MKKGKKIVSIQLRDVSKTFKTHSRPLSTLKQRLFSLGKKRKTKSIRALREIDLKIYRGECIGVIGRNGSGKSTLAKIMSGAFIPDRGGEVVKNGASLLLNLGVGFSHELTARENIYVNGSTLGLRIKQIDNIFDEIVEFAELEEFVDTKIKYFSSGMIQRLSFSIGIYAEADILFLDEVFAVGDNKFKEKATRVLEESWIEGRTTVLVSHSNALIKKYCNRTILMHKGEMIFFGNTDVAIKKYSKIV